MRLDIMPRQLLPQPKVRRAPRGLRGLGDDFGAPTGTSFGSGDTSGFINNLANPASLDLASFGSSVTTPSASFGSSVTTPSSLSSSPINWNSILPGLVGAGLSIYNTTTAADIQKNAINANAGTQQVQAAYGIAPPGYTYRGTAYNVQSSTGSSMPAGYSPTYSQTPAAGYVAAPASGLSSTVLLLLLGGAAFIMSRNKNG